MNRRTFLKTAAAGLAGWALLPLLPKMSPFDHLAEAVSRQSALMLENVGLTSPTWVMVMRPELYRRLEGAGLT